MFDRFYFTFIFCVLLLVWVSTITNKRKSNNSLCNQQGMSSRKRTSRCMPSTPIRITSTVSHEVLVTPTSLRTELKWPLVINLDIEDKEANAVENSRHPAVHSAPAPGEPGRARKRINFSHTLEFEDNRAILPLRRKSPQKEKSRSVDTIQLTDDDPSKREPKVRCLEPISLSLLEHFRQKMQMWDRARSEPWEESNGSHMCE